VGYELHPQTPPGGIPLAEYLPNADAMLRYVSSFAEGFGIRDLVPPTVLAPTRRVLALAEHARDAGRLPRLREVAFDAYWRRGWGLETDEDLRWISREAGLDPDAAVPAAHDPGLQARVAGARVAAAAAGVTGVPTFDFLRDDGAAAGRVVGCQRYEVLADAARRAGARRKGAAGPAHTR
jgi:predicted DsbA family dithiol-disulfide isomerase